MAIESKNKEEFCDLFIAELSAMKGKELSQYLSDVFLDMKSKSTGITLLFPIGTHIADTSISDFK